MHITTINFNLDIESKLSFDPKSVLANPNHPPTQIMDFNKLDQRQSQTPISKLRPAYATYIITFVQLALAESIYYAKQQLTKLQGCIQYKLVHLFPQPGPTRVNFFPHFLFSRAHSHTFYGLKLVHSALKTQTKP